MESRSFGNRWLIRLDSGEEVQATLLGFLRSRRIGFSFTSAAGGLRSARLGYWDAKSRSYRERDFEEQFEVLVMQGNSSWKDGEPFFHLHAVLGRADFSTLGGHVKRGVVHPTLEVWLRAEEEPVRREKDPATGLDLLSVQPPPS